MPRRLYSDIIVIGAGAAGLMAGWCAGRTCRDKGADKVTILEKMPRPGRKIVITGKGRCNFTNIKDWQDFSCHIHPKANPLRSAFQGLTPQRLISLFEENGMPCIVERGDRVFPASHKAMDVVDTLVSMVRNAGTAIICNCNVTKVEHGGSGFTLECAGGDIYECSKLIITCGGLSYPSTGSTGDGHNFAAALGHSVTRLYPSLTAIVPDGYKVHTGPDRHINRNTPLGPVGRHLCGRTMKCVSLSLLIDGTTVQEEFGDIEFTDGGLEGPIGYKVSRRAVIALENGSRVAVVISFPDGSEPLRFDIDGYVGYERAVVTAGGVDIDEIVPKSMASRKVRGLYFAGEVLDYDADTGGYNLHLAFCTGALAGLVKD